MTGADDVQPVPREPVAPPGSELEDRVDAVDDEIRAAVDAEADDVVEDDMDVVPKGEVPREQGTAVEPPD